MVIERKLKKLILYFGLVQEKLIPFDCYYCIITIKYKKLRLYHIKITVVNFEKTCLQLLRDDRNKVTYP